MGGNEKRKGVNRRKSQGRRHNAQTITSLTFIPLYRKQVAPAAALLVLGKKGREKNDALSGVLTSELAFIK